MPRTRIVDDQILDIDFISEIELNEFFGTVVITGTETDTQVVKNFPDYFVQSGIIVAGSGVVVSTGTTTITIASPENFSYETVISGAVVDIPNHQQMVVFEEFILDLGGELILNGTLILEQ